MAINKKYLDVAMSSNLFKNVDEKIVRKLLVSQYIAKAKKHENIMEPGMDGDGFIGLILKGKVSCYTEKGENCVILIDLKPGDAIGTSLNYDIKKVNLTLESLANTVYLKIPNDKYDELMHSDINFAYNLVRELGNTATYLIEKIKGFTAGSAERKLALFLRENIIPGTNMVSLPASMSKIAVTLSLGRASLYRAISTLEANNIILRTKKEVKILDMKKFEKMCNN